MTLPDGVHWHATSECGSRRPVDRVRLRRAAPDAVLRSPCAVAMWIDARTREHVQHREVYAGWDRMWVAIGDEDDLEHLRQENCLIAARGDSIHTDIYSPAERHALYVEAVTDEECTSGCSDQEPDRA